ncbi:YecA family protein [Delftia acidovorans]|uniref:YecA family protein n=1 Tax=Delftia acidovorans TaxID=80866 RepID=UPI0022AB6740|nr:SEC-C domain-containing protein [Delftia acidovorans]WAT83535.1 SEC-C domain-containing protein [Delftia acidovorans]
MKTGRNDPCWCKSGLKYKKCHLGREDQDPLPLGKISDLHGKAFNRKYCSAPQAWHNECAKKISKAHTVPKSLSLKAISRNGMVYGFTSTSIIDISKNKGKLLPKEIGINNASTFTGFCSTHDDGIFAPLEKVEFAASQEQCFLLAYRAVMREIYLKKSMANPSLPMQMLDKGRSVEVQKAIQFFSQLQGVGIDVATKDGKKHAERFEKVLIGRDYSEVRAFLVNFDEPPPVMCSGSFAPEYDFNGNKLQDLANLEIVPNIVSVNSFYDGAKGRFVLSWLQSDDPVCTELARSLDSIPDDLISSAILRFMFEFIENVYMKPDWWDGLSAEIKTAYIERMRRTALPGVARSQRCLMTDGWPIPSWPVSGRQWIG